MMEKDVYILAIESSCDETAAAVVRNGRDLLPDCPAHGVWRRGAGNCLPQAHRKNKSGD